MCGLCTLFIAGKFDFMRTAHLVFFELQHMLQVFLNIKGVALIVSFFLHFHKLLDILKNTLSPVQIYIKENLE